MKKKTDIKKLLQDTHAPSITAKGGYILVDKVESHIHLTLRMRFIRHFLELYARLSIRKAIFTQNTVTVFIASGDRIDTKIDTINKRLRKK